MAREGGEWAEAERRLAKLLAGQGRASPQTAWLQFYRSRIALDSGSVDALSHLQRAVELFVEVGEPLGEVYSRINLSRHHEGLGDLESALDQMRLGREAAEKTGDPGLVAETALQRLRLGVEAEGDLRALLLEIRALESAFYESGSHSFQRDLLLLRGRVSYELGDYDDAHDAYRLGAELCAVAGDGIAASAFQHNLVNLRLPRGRPADREEVIEGFRRGVALAESVGNSPVEVKARLALARLGAEDSGAQLETALRQAADLGPGLTAEALYVRAHALAEIDPESALEALRAGDAAAAQSDGPWKLLYAWNERLPVLWRALGASEGAEAARRTLDSIERLREMQRATSGRAQLLAPWTEVYRWLVGRLLLKGGEAAAAEAFEVIERMRARVLLDRLEDDSWGDSASGSPEEQEFLRQIVAVNRELLSTTLSAGEREDALARLTGLESRLELSRPLEAASGGRVSLPEVRRLLGPEEALLSFQIAPWEDIYGDFAGGSWLTVVTRDSTRVHRLPDRYELEDRMRVVRGLMVETGEVADIARARLFDQLLAEPLAQLPASVERLIVVTDGPLHHVAFAPLAAAPGSSLVSRYSLSHVPSASLWVRLRATGRPIPANALAVVDPDVGGAPAVARGWLDEGLELGRLSHAETEGRAMVRVFGEGSQVLAGAEATEERVKSEAAGFGWLHFGAHAVVDERHPARSGVVLAAGGAAEDGLLQPREIRKLSLDGAVVVLAACHSAGGAALEGEGRLSLARAFFAAGARAVVASLWEVSDEVSADLFAEFYPQVALGQSVDAALAHAQHILAGRGLPPADWAGFVVLGDGG